MVEGEAVRRLQSKGWGEQRNAELAELAAELEPVVAGRNADMVGPRWIQ